MKFALVDIRIPTACEVALAELGYEVIKLPPHRSLPAPLASHPDMLIFYSGSALLTSKEYYEENRELFDRISRLSGVKISLTEEKQGERYPADAIFNALRLGSRVILRKKNVSRALTELALSEGFELISVNQGYPACTTLPLSPSHIITADRGVANVLSGYGIRVTLIESGDIFLPPYEYGFIGGASGVDNDCAYFFGDIRTHRSYKDIIYAIEGEGLRAVSLGEGALCDLGGIIFIKKEG